MSDVTNTTQYEVRGHMTPDDARKALRRAKQTAEVICHVSATVGMPSSEGREYPWFTSLKVTQNVMFKLLEDMQRFHLAKVARGETPPMVDYRQSLTTFESYGDRPAKNIRHVWIG